MHPPPNHLKLDCALTNYLEEASHESGGVKAAFAAAMLADLGYFASEPAPQFEENVRSLLEMLVKGGYERNLKEIQDHCTACELLSNCAVGQIVQIP